MSPSAKILFKSFIKPFYRQNAGFFVFVFTMLFFIVNKVDGADLLDYHYSLITAILQSNVILLLVFFSWLLYARKCFAFIAGIVRKPEYSYLQIFNSLPKSKQLRLLLYTEVWLMLPILSYAIFIVYIGLRYHFYLPVLFVISYLLILTVSTAAGHLYLFNNPGKERASLFQKLIGSRLLLSNYSTIIIGAVIHQQKLTWAGIKIFTCGILYLVARNNTLTEYDVQTVFVFYNFGILANAIIIYKIREFEEMYLAFYRSLPVSTMKRFFRYLLIYVILLIPEFITVYLLTPIHLHYTDAFDFSLCSLAVLLLMNSITFIKTINSKEFFKIILIVYCLQYIVIMTLGLVALYLLLFISVLWIFLISYLNYERTAEP